MIKCLLTGQVNSGKSSLIMSLAKYNSNLQVLVSKEGSEKSEHIVNVEQNQISKEEYSTKELTHYIFLMGERGKYYKFEMIDSIGIIDDIYDNVEYRDGVWNLFFQLTQCDILIHTINAQKHGFHHGLNLMSLENEILKYQQKKNKKSIICATFSDVKSAKKGVKIIRKEFPDIPVIAVSNETGMGISRLNRVMVDYAAL